MDERLRARERAAQEGDLEARAQFLSEAVRQGSLSAAQLEVLAWAGDPAALALIPGLDPPADLHVWVRGLARRDPASTARALSSAAELAPPRPGRPLRLDVPALLSRPIDAEARELVPLTLALAERLWFARGAPAGDPDLGARELREAVRRGIVGQVG